MTRKIRAPIADLATGERTLDRATSRYLVRALRLRTGDSLVVFDPARGREAEATLVREDREAVVLAVGPTREARVVARRPITWIQGVAKGDKMDAVVRDLTELGATRFVPALTSFSAVKLDAPRGDARRERWERIAREAARQCGRGDAPVVERTCPWNEGLAKADVAGARFCLYERATEPIGPAFEEAVRGGGPLAFAAGPEGGLAPDEVEEAKRGGWAIVSLGAFVLRTETVATAVLGAIRVLGR